MTNSVDNESPRDIDFDKVVEDEAEIQVFPADITPSASDWNAEVQSDVLGGNFDSEHTVPEYVNNSLRQLSTFQRWMAGRDLQKIQREQLVRIAREFFNYQYQDMQHMLMLGMDVQKKSRFVQYLRETKDLQEQIQRQSAEFSLSFVVTSFDERMNAYEAKTDLEGRFKKKFDARVLTQAQYERALRDAQLKFEEHIARLDQTRERLIARHSELLHKTLETFRSEWPEEHIR